MVSEILVVDPDALVRRQVAAALASAGFVSHPARDGWEGLDRLASRRVSLVFCDLLMPGMNGVELLAALREIDDGDPPPTVLFAGRADPRLLSRARSLGAKGWIAKPLPLELVVMAAHKLTAPARGVVTSSPVRRAG